MRSSVLLPYQDTTAYADVMFAVLSRCMPTYWKDAAKVVDSCKYLVLEDVEVVRNYGLRVRIAEVVGQAGRPEDPDRDFAPELAAKIKARSRFEGEYLPLRFEIAFREIISYMVTNETYGKYPEPPESFAGKFFRVFSWSYYLELARKTTHASDEHPGPGPLQHYEVACLNDVIDVITCSEPEISVLSSGS